MAQFCKSCLEPIEPVVGRPPFAQRCSSCHQYQDWFSTALQPDWWPKWLPSRNIQGFKFRWTHWLLSLCVLALCVSPVVAGISSVVLKAAPKEYFVPDMTGFNLQSAQNCLQELGFYNLDDKPAAGEPRFQVNDSNWTVTGQNVRGKVQSDEIAIVLYARKTGGMTEDQFSGDGYRSCDQLEFGS